MLIHGLVGVNGVVASFFVFPLFAIPQTEHKLKKDGGNICTGLMDKKTTRVPAKLLCHYVT